MYDSIHPALFSRGSREANTSYGLCTPPISPSRPTKENNRLEVFLTSEVGERAGGVLHEGVVEVEFEKKSTSFDVSAKLAFTSQQQRKLARELSMYTLMESKRVKGIPTVIGIFHEVETNGPLCLIISHAGQSLYKSRTCITSRQRYTSIRVFGCSP